MQKDETSQLMQEKEPVLKNLDEIIVKGELNQHDDLLTEEISVSATYCICLK